MCLQTGRTGCSLGLSVRRSARQPRELWFLAVRYCRRRRITHGPGSADAVGSRGIRCSPGRDASVITFISVSRGTCPGTLRFGESTDSTRSHAMVFLRPPVLCDGSKRQTTAFDRYSHPASPPRDTTPVFSFHNCYLSMTTFMVVARSSVARASRL